MAIQTYPGPAPFSIEFITREQFLAPSSFGKLSAEDLLWILYHAAKDAGPDAAKFIEGVEDLLAGRLGADRYRLFLVTYQNGSAGYYALAPAPLPGNHQLWAGDAGALPGFGATNAVSCLVWWTDQTAAG